jgi:hypothetical protein
MKATTLNDSIPPGKNFDKACFRLWYPDNSGTIEGIIVLMPGSNYDGRSSVDDSSWQELALKFNFALLGCYYTDYPDDNMMIEKYVNVKEGSGQAMLEALSLFAGKSGHVELNSVPFLLWGHSAGGEFNFEFVCWKPERVIAFVVNKGGFYYTALAPEGARDVPGLFFTGEKDMDERKQIIEGIYSMNRRAGAKWAFAEEPLAEHEVGQTQKLAEVFFGEVIPIRLKKLSPDRFGYPELMKLSDGSAFIGYNNGKICQSFAEAQNKDSSTSWLINSVFADKWLSFLKNNPF